jgi:hypothetical protein
MLLIRSYEYTICNRPRVISSAGSSVVQSSRVLRGRGGYRRAWNFQDSWRPSEAILPRRIILFLGANPRDTRRLALRQECAAIKRELRLATHGGEFEFQYKWPVTVDKMAQLLISSKPTIIHFSGHGAGGASSSRMVETTRDVTAADTGIYLDDDQSLSQLVTPRALAMMVKTAAPATRVVVLNACYSDQHADALCQVVDCVVGMTTAIDDEAARSFAVGFYRALAFGRSVGDAVDHARATLAAKRFPDEHAPRSRTRNLADARQIFL